MCKRQRFLFLALGFGLLFANVMLTKLHAQATQGNQQNQQDKQSQQGTATLDIIQSSFNAVADKVLPVVVEINTVEVVRQRGPQSVPPFDFFFGPEGPDQDQQPPEQQSPEQQQPPEQQPPEQQQKSGQQQKTQQPPEQGREFRRPGLGSGVIVRKDGNKVFVITNDHVVGTADKISIRLHDNRQFQAVIVGKDSRTDLALVSFEAPGDFPIAKLGNYENVKVGDWALAVGNPFGFESTMTMGIISAVSRTTAGPANLSAYVDFIQTDASINPGNSGGGLFNIRAELVGINSWIASQTGGSIGLGFAIPVNIVQKAINDFIKQGKIVYGWLGVQVLGDDFAYFPEMAEQLHIQNQNGGLIFNIFRGSPAEKSGLLPGDFVTKIGDVNIENADHLTRVVGSLAPDQTIKINLIRYGEPQEVTVKIEARGEESKVQENNNLWPGMLVVPIVEDLRTQFGIGKDAQGVIIAQVVEGSPAGDSGFKPGDLILRIANTKVTDLISFYKSLNQGTGEIIFRISRQGHEFLIGIDKGK